MKQYKFLPEILKSNMLERRVAKGRITINHLKTNCNEKNLFIIAMLTLASCQKETNSFPELIPSLILPILKSYWL
jgi:hypothetical protein